MPKSRDTVRKPSPVLLLEDTEKNPFNKYAMSLGWSLGKYLRVSGRACMLFNLKKTESFKQAWEHAIILDNKDR